MELPTVTIRDGAGKKVINRSDYNPKTMKLWTPPAPSPEPPAETNE